MANVLALITYHKRQIRLWWPHRFYHFPDSVQPNAYTRYQIKLNLSMIRAYQAYVRGQAPLPIPPSYFEEYAVSGWASIEASSADMHLIPIEEVQT